MMLIRLKHSNKHTVQITREILIENRPKVYTKELCEIEDEDLDALDDALNNWNFTTSN